MLICITDQDNKTVVKEESFLANKYMVISRSGLNITEMQIIEAIKGFFFWKTGQGFLVLLRGAYIPKRRSLSIAWTCIMLAKSGETC